MSPAAHAAIWRSFRNTPDWRRSQALSPVRLQTGYAWCSRFEPLRWLMLHSAAKFQNVRSDPSVLASDDIKPPGNPFGACSLGQDIWPARQNLRSAVPATTTLAGGFMETSGRIRTPTSRCHGGEITFRAPFANRQAAIPSPQKLRCGSEAAQFNAQARAHG